MFPTTVWTRIHDAGARDHNALQEFAERYRPPVLAYIRRRGFKPPVDEDLCQNVFLRVFRGGVLAKADRTRGRFRSLLLAVTTHVIQDHLRKRGEIPAALVEPADRNDDFDHAWALHLTECALNQMREEGSPYYEVLMGHLNGERPTRQKLWLARRKLGSVIRREVALTCTTQAEFEEEMSYLSRFLVSPRKQ